MPYTLEQVQTLARQRQVEQTRQYFQRLIDKFQSGQINPTQFLTNLSSYRQAIYDAWDHSSAVSPTVINETIQLSLTFVQVAGALPIYGGQIGLWSNVLEQASVFYESAARWHDYAECQIYRIIESAISEDYESAIARAEQTFKLSKRLELPLIMLRAAYLWVDVLIDYDELASIPGILHEAEIELANVSTSHIDYAASVACLLAIHAQYDRRLDERNNAFMCWNEVIELLDALAEPPQWLHAVAYRSRGLIYTELGDDAAAVRDFEIAIQYYERLGYVIPLAYTYQLLGTAYWGLGCLEQALDVLKRGIGLTAQARALSYQVRLSGMLGLVYFARGQLEVAEIYLQSAYEQASQYQMVTESSNVAGNQGLVWLYQALRSTEPAREVLLSRAEQRLTEALCESLHSQIEQAACLELANLALLYQFRGKLERAQRFARKALRIAERLGQRSLHIVALRCYAEVTINRQERALLLYHSLSLAQEAGRRLDEAACLLGLANIADNEVARSNQWECGVQILHDIDAAEWITGYNVDNPPYILALA